MNYQFLRSYGAALLLASPAVITNTKLHSDQINYYGDPFFHAVCKKFAEPQMSDKHTHNMT